MSLIGWLLVEGGGGAVSKDSLSERAHTSLSQSPVWTQAVNQTADPPPPQEG